MANAEPCDPKEKAHHHGDLYNALIRAGMELLQEGGITALTLRGCAAKANVSHAAPKHHFKNVAELKGAVGAACFEMFNTFMQDAAANGPQTPRGRLKSICRGYLQFALTRPAFFDAIFSTNALNTLTIEKKDEPSGAYRTLQEACAPFIPKGQDPVIIETQVWSLIHGYALLARMGRFHPDNLTGPQFDTSALPGAGPFDEVMQLLDHIGKT